MPPAQLPTLSRHGGQRPLTWIVLAALVAAVLLTGSTPATANTPSPFPQSTGADGACDFPVSLQLDTITNTAYTADGALFRTGFGSGGIYNCTTITVAAGATVTARGGGGVLDFRATGPAHIDGSVNLRGSQGSDCGGATGLAGFPACATADIGAGGPGGVRSEGQNGTNVSGFDTIPGHGGHFGGGGAAKPIMTLSGGSAGGGGGGGDAGGGGGVAGVPVGIGAGVVGGRGGGSGGGAGGVLSAEACGGKGGSSSSDPAFAGQDGFCSLPLGLQGGGGGGSVGNAAATDLAMVNSFVPGAGGGGSGVPGGGGGGGGGALRMVSADSITIGGGLSASGGDGGSMGGGGGSGGAIFLAAPTITIASGAAVTVNRGIGIYSPVEGGAGGPGRVRLAADHLAVGGAIPPGDHTNATLGRTFLTPYTPTIELVDAPTTVTAGGASDPFTVQLRDPNGNLLPAGPSGVVLYLRTSSAGGGFRDATDPSTAISQLAIPPESSTASFRYRDTMAGTAIITVADQASGSDTGLRDVSAQVTVNPGPLAELVLTPATATIDSGGSQAYSARGVDAFGNNLGDRTPQASFTITPDGNCTGATCTATVTGDHLVTGTLGTASGDATLTVRAMAQLLNGQVQQPINPDGSSVFDAKRGVVPVKFTLTADGTPTCTLPPATIQVTRIGGTAPGPIDESVYSSPADGGPNFRISNCQYVYNLAARALGPGTYQVDILIGASTVGRATFALK